uniref:Dolichol-phosphate mannosyltransferase subunit 3 n=1 Tax=Parastrongyloides trichosuri TaxID=131310 RepID=A0A0N4ZTR5_PARTI
MATQLVLFTSFFLPIFITWLGLYNEWIPIINKSLPSFLNYIMGYIPFFFIGGLGMYALFSITFGVLNFNDCKTAQLELMDEVEEVKKELKERNIIS